LSAGHSRLQAGACCRKERMIDCRNHKVVARGCDMRGWPACLAHPLRLPRCGKPSGQQRYGVPTTVDSSDEQKIYCEGWRAYRKGGRGGRSAKGAEPPRRLLVFNSLFSLPRRTTRRPVSSVRESERLGPEGLGLKKICPTSKPGGPGRATKKEEERPPRHYGRMALRRRSDDRVGRCCARAA
jgi:hypothetical protein